MKELASRHRQGDARLARSSSASCVMIRQVLLVLLPLWLALVSPVSAQEKSIVGAPQYELGSGDKLRITFYGKHYSDLSGDYEVDGSGLVPLPLVGSIHLAGETLERASAAIKDAYQPEYIKDPQVSVQVLNYRPFYIFGQVNSPGSYPYVNGITVLEAVVIAGGFTKRAKESSMTIIRGGDATRATQEAMPGTIILPGDVIEVPQRYF